MTSDRYLWAGAAVSALLHLLIITGVASVEIDVHQTIRKVKLRMVEERRERREQKPEIDRRKELEEKKKKEEEKQKEAIAKALEKKKQEEARKKEELKKAPPKELPKPEEKKDPPKIPPKPETKAEETKPPEEKPKPKPKPKAKEKPAEEKPAEEKPQEAEKPPEPPKWGAPIDLDYAMSGGTSGGGAASGTGVPVIAGDGLDVPKDGAAAAAEAATTSPDGAILEPDSAAAGAGEEEDQEEDQEAAVDRVLAASAGSEGKGGKTGKEGRDSKGGNDGTDSSNRKRVVKTTAVHKVTSGAKVLKDIEVAYPEEIKGLEIQGRVLLQLTVDKEGKVADVVLKKGLHPVLDKVAMEAAWNLLFSPAIQDGKPVATKIPYSFVFVLE